MGSFKTDPRLVCYATDFNLGQATVFSLASNNAFLSNRACIYLVRITSQQ